MSLLDPMGPDEARALEESDDEEREEREPMGTYGDGPCARCGRQDHEHVSMMRSGACRDWVPPGTRWAVKLADGTWAASHDAVTSATKSGRATFDDVDVALMCLHDWRSTERFSEGGDAKPREAYRLVRILPKRQAPTKTRATAIKELVGLRDATEDDIDLALNDHDDIKARVLRARRDALYEALIVLGWKP